MKGVIKRLVSVASAAAITASVVFGTPFGDFDGLAAQTVPPYCPLSGL